jgi:thiamine pyrophosphate-dependent acetolactate synthase large subunit-like protein
MPAGEGWKPRALPHPPQASPDQIAAATQKLAAANAPVIVLGGGALHAGDAAIAIAEKLQAPVLTTTAGKGAIRADHPLCFGYCLAAQAAQALLASSDAILCAGSELSETDFWTSDFVIGANLIRIDIDPASLARPHVAEIAILSDARIALEAIAEKVWSRTAAAPLRIPSKDDAPARAMLSEMLAVIRHSLPEETVIASDMTQIAYVANEAFPVNRPRTWLHPVGFGTLGFALPAGIGAKFGAGATPVAVLIGDYGIQYTINELGTAAEHGLPIPILVWNNDLLGAIHDDMVRKGIQPNAVSLKNPDFQLLAKAYGCHAEKPSSLKALAAAITAALAADCPTLIEMTPRMLHG